MAMTNSIHHNWVSIIKSCLPLQFFSILTESGTSRSFSLDPLQLIFRYQMVHSIWIASASEGLLDSLIGGLLIGNLPWFPPGDMALHFRLHTSSKRTSPPITSASSVVFIASTKRTCRPGSNMWQVQSTQTSLLDCEILRPDIFNKYAHKPWTLREWL